jgi:hypothetical protein
LQVARLGTKDPQCPLIGVAGEQYIHLAPGHGAIEQPPPCRVDDVGHAVT